MQNTLPKHCTGEPSTSLVTHTVAKPNRVEYTIEIKINNPKYKMILF